MRSFDGRTGFRTDSASRLGAEESTQKEVEMRQRTSYSSPLGSCL